MLNIKVYEYKIIRSCIKKFDWNNEDDGGALVPTFKASIQKLNVLGSKGIAIVYEYYMRSLNNYVWRWYLVILAKFSRSTNKYMLMIFSQKSWLMTWVFLCLPRNYINIFLEYYFVMFIFYFVSAIYIERIVFGAKNPPRRIF